MNEKITIAVVIPSYNAAMTIKDCIYSVLDQKAKVNEIIIVDDGSIDDTRLIVKQIFESCSDGIRKILIEQQNQGPSLARNRGVDASTSTHIAFLDSDDKWFNEKIELEKAFLENNSCYDIIASKYLSAPFKNSGEITFKQLLKRNYFLTPCVVIKKQTFINCGGFNENMRYAEDLLLWLTVVYNSKGYLLSYLGAANIDKKKPFGDTGLSSNLREMHKGVLSCYNILLNEGKISSLTYLNVFIWEKMKYLRRRILSKQLFD